MQQGWQSSSCRQSWESMGWILEMAGAPLCFSVQNAKQVALKSRVRGTTHLRKQAKQKTTAKNHGEVSLLVFIVKAKPGYSPAAILLSLEIAAVSVHAGVRLLVAAWKQEHRFQMSQKQCFS